MKTYEQTRRLGSQPAVIFVLSNSSKLPATLQVNKPVPVSLNWLVLNLLHLYWALIQEPSMLEREHPVMPLCTRVFSFIYRCLRDLEQLKAHVVANNTIYFFVQQQKTLSFRIQKAFTISPDQPLSAGCRGG